MAKKHGEMEEREGKGGKESFGARMAKYRGKKGRGKKRGKKSRGEASERY